MAMRLGLPLILGLLICCGPRTVLPSGLRDRNTIWSRIIV